MAIPHQSLEVGLDGTHLSVQKRIRRLIEQSIDHLFPDSEFESCT
ncbi:hypothetical protein [Cryobacterium sp. Hb1]|nr:hypothetical protein [Cryobacterium sp. Hb1]